MEFGSPVRQNSTTYIAPVETTNLFDTKYPSSTSNSNTSPPTNTIEMKQYLSIIALAYEQYSLKWFNKKIPAFYFIQNITHNWDYSSAPPYTGDPNFIGSTVLVHQVWRPETILIQPTLFQINWVLQTSDYSSYSVTKHSPGTAGESEEIPYGDNQGQFVLSETPRSIFHRKIRRAKLIASITKLRVNKLYLKYYKLYGEFTPDGEDSPLSSDSEI
jgi:hypothetical protein